MSFDNPKLDLHRQSVEHFEKEGPVRRNALSKDRLLEHIHGHKTVYELIRSTFTTVPDKPFFGSRQHLNDGTWSSYVFRTYREVWRDVLALAASLKQLGLKKGDFVGIYSINREDWMITAFACVTQGFCIVPLYDTLGPNAIKFIIEHAELATVVCSAKTYPNIAAVSHQCPSLKTVILMDDVPTPLKQKASSAITFHHLNVLVRQGYNLEKRDNPGTPQDLFIVMYTSGTTGNPKGVMLTNRNIVAGVGGIHADLPDVDEAYYLSYLPLAHIYEMIVFLSIIAKAGTIGFWRGDINMLIEDIQELRPTIFVGVPRVFNKVYDKVMSQLQEGGAIKQFLFNIAYSNKKSALQNGQDTPFWNRLVFKKISDALGGRVIMIASGSAPLSKEVQEFFRVATGAKTIQGYGLTETCAALTKQLLDDQDTSGHVGPPLMCCEVKLVDVAEMGYLSCNEPQQGEVCVRGPNVFVGYYKDEEKTKEVLTDDGWFHTGDIGEWLPNGSLKIIDRKKNIFKLAQGEYIAVEMIETILSRSKYVMQLLVIGDSLKEYLVAIVVPDSDTIIPLAKTFGIHENSIEVICKDERIKRSIYNDLVNTGVTSKLSGFQIPKNIYLETEPWTVENDMLTPSMKIKRHAMGKVYESVIETLYSEPRMDLNVSKL